MNAEVRRAIREEVDLACEKLPVLQTILASYDDADQAQADFNIRDILRAVVVEIGHAQDAARTGEETP